MQDTVVLWSKSPTLDRKVKGSNPAAANFSFEVDNFDAGRKKKKTETKTGAPANDHWRASALEIGLETKILGMNEKGIDSKDVDWTTIDAWSIQEYEARNKTSWRPLHWMLPKQLFIRRDGEKIYKYKSV